LESYPFNKIAYAYRAVVVVSAPPTSLEPVVPPPSLLLVQFVFCTPITSVHVLAAPASVSFAKRNVLGLKFSVLDFAGDHAAVTAEAAISTKPKIENFFIKNKFKWLRNIKMAII
jgi:hypothetical protein